MLPNLILIGGQKCGTSSLHYYLGLHPQIRMSARKELDYFALNGNWPRGRDWYEAQFTHAGAAVIRGESSPSYTDYPRRPGVPERMRALLPDARLIFLVRDPVARVVSNYHHQAARGIEQRPLAAAVRAPENFNYIGRSRYWLQLEQYLAYYPAPQLLIVASEELMERRRETLQLIFRWLGVTELFDSPKFDGLRNQARDKRRRTWLGRRLEPWASGWAARESVPPWLRWRLEDLPYWPLSRAQPLPVLTEELRRELVDLFRDDVARLRAFTGQAFPHWNL